MTNPKRFWMRVFLFAPILFALIVVNYVVDPGNLFDQENQGERIANRLIQGGYVANALYCDNGIWHRDYIERMSKPQVVVFGSSRSANLHADVFQTNSFLNASVGNARLGDLMALYNMLRRTGKKPTQLMIAVDPWMIESSGDWMRWNSMREDFLSLAEKMHWRVDWNARLSLTLPVEYLELVSPAYSQKAIALLFQTQRNFKCFPIDTAYSNVEVTWSDGSMSWSGEKSDPALRVNSARFKAEQTVKSESLLESQRINTPNTRAIDQFKQFIELIKGDQVTVTLLLIPYHPLAYQGLTRGGEASWLVSAQRAFTQIATETKIQLIGSYDPVDCRLAEESFFDALHADENAIRAVVEYGCVAGRN